MGSRKILKCALMFFLSEPLFLGCDVKKQNNLSKEEIALDNAIKNIKEEHVQIPARPRNLDVAKRTANFEAAI